MDTLTREKRSWNMAQIHSKGTKPEEMVRKYLFAHGFRYRKNDKRFPGKPDIVLPKYHTVVFVNGCFWHNHEGCKDGGIPKTNTDFWRNKIEKNVIRDYQHYNDLTNMGWKVIVVWECELKKNLFDSTMEKLMHSLKSC